MSLLSESTGYNSVMFRAVAVRFHPSLPERWVPACTEAPFEVTLHIIQAPLINLLTRETWDLQPTCGVLTPLVTRLLETKTPQSTSQTTQVSVLSQAGKACGLEVLSRADDLAPGLWVQSFFSPVIQKAYYTSVFFFSTWLELKSSSKQNHGFSCHVLF